MLEDLALMAESLCVNRLGVTAKHQKYPSSSGHFSSHFWNSILWCSRIKLNQVVKSTPVTSPWLPRYSTSQTYTFCHTEFSLTLILRDGYCFYLLTQRNDLKRVYVYCLEPMLIFCSFSRDQQRKYLCNIYNTLTGTQSCA